MIQVPNLFDYDDKYLFCLKHFLTDNSNCDKIIYADVQDKTCLPVQVDFSVADNIQFVMGKVFIF